LKSDDLFNKDDEEDESTTTLRGVRKPLLEGNSDASSQA